MTNTETINGTQPLTEAEALAYCKHHNTELRGKLCRYDGVFVFESERDDDDCGAFIVLRQCELFRAMGPEVARNFVAMQPGERVFVRLRLELEASTGVISIDPV